MNKRTLPLGTIVALMLGATAPGDVQAATPEQPTAGRWTIQNPFAENLSITPKYPVSYRHSLSTKFGQAPVAESEKPKPYLIPSIGESWQHQFYQPNREQYKQYNRGNSFRMDVF